jgi:hypothetical protein
MKSTCLDDLDFGGALIFLLLLGGLHLLVRPAALAGTCKQHGLCRPLVHWLANKRGKQWVRVWGMTLLEH